MNTLFPFNHSKNHDDLLFGDKKDGIAMMMGLEAQGYQDFVKRSLDDGAGWNEISKVIGWINFGVFKSYYQKLYNEEIDQLNMILIEPAHQEQEGWFLYDHTKKEWRLMTETIDTGQSYGLPPAKVERIIFMPRNKENKEEQIKYLNENYHLDFNMTESSPFNNICFHATMAKGNEVITLSNSDWQVLVYDIKENQHNGFLLTTTIYFDLPSIDDNDKLRIMREEKEIITKKTGIIFP